MSHFLLFPISIIIFKLDASSCKHFHFPTDCIDMKIKLSLLDVQSVIYFIMVKLNLYDWFFNLYMYCCNFSAGG